jgi:hypothetical protein
MAPPTATITETTPARLSVAATEPTKKDDERSWNEDVHYLGDKEGKVKLR